LRRDREPVDAARLDPQAGKEPAPAEEAADALGAEEGDARWPALPGVRERLSVPRAEPDPPGDAAILERGLLPAGSSPHPGSRASIAEPRHHRLDELGRRRVDPYLLRDTRRIFGGQRRSRVRGRKVDRVPGALMATLRGR